MATINMQKGEKVTGDEILEALLKRAKNIDSTFSGVHTMTVKVDGVDKVLSDFKELDDAVKSYEKLASSKKNTNGIAKYYGSQEKMVANLQNAWNNYVDDVKNGNVDFNNLQQNKSAKSVLRYANALEAAYGGDAINMISNDTNVLNTVKSFVSEMRNMPMFQEGRYNFDVGHLREVFDLLKRIQNEATNVGVDQGGIVDIYKALGLEDVDKIKQSTKDLSDTIDDYLQIRQRATTPMNDNQSNDISDDTENTLDDEKQKIDEKKKQYEKIEEIRAKVNEKHNRIVYDNDEDYNSNASYDTMINSEDNKLKELSEIMGKLRQKREELVNEISSDEEWYNYSMEQGNDSNVERYSRYLSDEYEQLLNLDEQIEYIGKSLSETSLEFTPGDSWGGDEIQALINLLQTLVQEIQKVSNAFGSLDDGEGITTLLSQLSNIGTSISEAFDVNNLQEFKSQLSEMVGILNQLSLSIGVIGDGKTNKSRNNTSSIRELLQKQLGKTAEASNIVIDVSGDNMSQMKKQEKEEELMLKQQRDRYVKGYNKVFDIFQSYNLNNTPEQFLVGLYSGSKNFEEQNYGQDVVSSYNRANIINRYINPEDQINSIARFFDDIKNGISDMLDKSLWTGFGDDIRSHIMKIFNVDDYLTLSDSQLQKGFVDWKKNNSKLIKDYFKDDAYYGVYKYLTSSSSPASNTKNINKKIDKIYGLDKSAESAEPEGSDDSFMGLMSNLSNIKNYQDQIKSLIETLEALQTTVSTGLGISELDDGTTTTFFDKLIEQMKEVINTAKEMTQALTNINIQKNGIDDSMRSKVDENSIIDNDDSINNIVGDAQEKVAEVVRTSANAINSVNETETLSGIQQSSDTLDKEAEKFQNVGESATTASLAKDKFTEANQKAAESAQETSQNNDKEAESFDVVRHAAQSAQDNNYIYTDQTDYNNGDYSYTKYTGFAQRERVRVSHDENGEEFISAQNISTNYRKLENEIIKVDGIILGLMNDLENGIEHGNPTEQIQNLLNFFGDRSSRLQNELDAYYRQQNYLPENAQVQDFNQRRREAGELAIMRINRRNDENYNRDLQRDSTTYDRLVNQRAVETNLEPEQQADLDRIINRRAELNRLMQNGIALSHQEQDFLNRTSISDDNATRRREILEEELRISEEEARLQEERERGRQQTEQETQRSEKIQQEYEKLLSVFDELYQAKSKMNELEANAELDPEITNTNEWAEATERLANANISAATARKTLLAMKDDLTDEQYTDAVNASKKASFGSGKSQDKKHREEINNIQSIAKEYNDAQSEMNNLKARVITGELDVTSQEYKQAEERLQKAYDAAMDAKEKLDKLKSSISKEKYDELSDELGKGDLGSATSIDKINKAYGTQYDNNIKMINEAIKARSELNDVYAQKYSGKVVENETESIERFNNALNKAQNALESIRAMHISGLIDDDELKAAEDLFEKSKIGDEKSRNRLANAYQNKEYDQVKKSIQEYEQLYDEYYKLQQKQLSGDMVDSSHMESVLNRMCDIERNWNDEKAKGVELNNKQLDIAKHISSQHEKIKTTGKSDTDELVKEDVEGDIIQKEYNKVKNKIQKMYDASDWRKGEWVPRVDQLKDELQNVDFNQPFEDVLSNIQKIEQEIQQVSKSIEFQPVRENWVSTTKSNLLKWMNQNKIAAKEYKDQLDEIIVDIDKVESKGDAAKITDRINDIQGDAAARNLTGKSLGDRFRDQFANTMTSLATYYLSFQDFVRYGREAISMVTELDTQLTEMRKVSSESLQSLQDYQLETFDIADRVGTTATQIQSSTADWLRLGKNLPQASEMAELSTKLLNVSEFTDIKDATDALVSSTQAYTEVQASDIVDKLNLIGNNYAVSTDELAQGLQNAGAVLKTQGNDIDQTLALLTAGNLIGQDMSKASAGIRTIALRISGTEEAKNEIADMGEDVDDFVVRTKSKTDQIIRDYTAVASNAYKGVSVLDENGNLRDTYDILLDISKIYKEIQEEDKQRGTNRAQALIETLAGKNRSNIVASILQNGDILEAVREDSLNDFKGSADEELGKYLDSIEGKVAQFKNRLQELASVSIDTTWIKNIVDFGSSALSVVTSLSKQFGSLNIVLGSIAGFALQKSGLGILNYDKENGFSSIFSNMIKSSKKASIEIPNNFTKIINAVNANTTEKGRQDNLVNWDGFFAKHDVTDKNFQNFIKDTKFPTKDLENYIKYTQEAQNATGGFSAVLSNLGSIGASVLSTLATQAVAIAATWAAGALIKGISDWIRQDEIAIEKGKEATQVIEDQYKAYQDLNTVLQDMGKSASGKDEISDTPEAITEIADKYSELRNGVNEFTNANQTLSTEKYQEYLDISNQIAEQFPSLVSGYDEQGNAILNIGNSADQAEQALMRMYNASKLAANVAIMDNLGDSYKGYETQIQQRVEENEKLLKRNKDLQKNLRDNQVEQILGNIGEWAEINEDAITIKNYTPEKGDKLRKVLSQQGLAPEFYNIEPEIGQDTVAWVNGLSNLSEETIRSIQDQLYNGVKSSVEMAEDGIKQEMLLNDNKIATNELFIKDQRKAITKTLSDALSTSDIFDSQSQAIQDAILSNISDMSLSSLSTTYGGDIYSFLYGELIGPINKLTPEMQDSLNDLLELDPSTMDAGKYVNAIETGLADIFNNDPTDMARWKSFLGFDNIFNEVASEFTDIKGEFNLEGATPMSEEDIEALYGLSLDDLRSYASLVRTGIYKTWEELQEAFENAKKEKDIEKDGTLQDLFNDESYQTNAEQYEKSLSSLTSALETMRNEGKLSASAMKDLQEEFPNLTDFSEEAIEDLTSSKLGDWITDIEKKAKELDFSPEGMEELNTYLDNLIHSYGDLGISAEEARSAVIQSFVGDAKTYGEVDARSKLGAERYEEVIEQLKAQYGEDINYQIIWELAMEDRFSDPAADIEAEYADKKLKWEIEIANAEELARIQKDLEVEESKRNLTKAKQSKREAAGKDLAESDYAEIGESLANTTELKRQAQEIAQDNYDYAVEALDKETAKALVSGETINSLKKNGGVPTSALQAMSDVRENQLKNVTNDVKTAQKELNEAEADTVNAETEELENRIQRYQAESTKLQNAYSGLEDGANQIQNSLKKHEKLGMDYTKGQYAELINNAQDQMENIGLQIDAKKAELTKYENDTDIGVNSKLYRDTEAAITELEGKQIDLKQQTQEWQTMISTGIELNQTKRDLEDLQTDATNIQDVMSFRETRGLKATVKDYQKLMKNSAEQIKNIKTQNDLLRQQQAELIANNGVAAMQSSTYRDIQAQIESNNQSLRGLAQNQYDWGKQMATGQIQNIMDSMSAAQQAMSTGHLADTDTLKNLITMNRDYASALVTTTTGTYVDAQAMAKLAEDQGDLTIAMIDAQKAAEMMNYESNVDQMMSMAQQIDPTITSIQQLNQALAEHPDSPEWSKIFDLSEANFNIQSNLDQLQAMKEQILATQSYLGQYQMAQSSWNFSDPMQQIRGGLEGAKQLYDQGWWGKDDFTSFAKMIATNEQLQQETFVDNFMDNYQRAQKYLTEDRTGVENWISKMREEGYVDEKGDFDIKSMERFANDMGFNTEFSEYMLMAMKDAGYQVDISRLGDKYAESYKQITGTEANAGLQMQDLLSQMRESARAGEDIRTSAEQAGAALQRMKEAGMSDDAISKLVEQYNELGDMTGFHIDPQTLEVTTTVDKSELEETEEEINQPKDMMVQIKEEYDISDEDITKTNNAIQRTFEGNKANLDQELSTSGLSDYSAEDLLKIDFEDGQYLPDTAEAESALENLAVKIGLVGSKSEVTNDVAQALVATLLELNSIQSETEQNMGETGQTPSQVVGADKTLSYEAAARQYDSTPWYKKVATEASQTVSSASSSGKSFIESGASAIQSGLDTITQPLRVKQQIETVLENGTTLNELKQMTDDQLISVGFEAEGLDEVKSQVDELIQTDGADMVIKINEEQFDTLGTTISDSVKNAFTNIDSTEATTAMEEITTSYEELETAMSGDPLKINIDTSDAVSSLDELKQAMEKLGLSYNSGNAEGEENATAPAESFETAHREIQSMRQKPQINNASQSSESVDSTGDNVEQVQVPATAVVDEVDDSNVQDEEIDMDAKVELEADTSSLDTVEAEAETPIEKKVELSVSPSANPLLEGGMTGAGTIEQTTIQKTVEEHEQHNIIKNEVQGDASDATEASSEAESAIDSVPTEHTTDINANDNASTPANNAKNAIESVPTSRSATITATISGLENVTSLKDAIDKLQDKEITIKATTVNIDGTTSSSTSVTKPSSANAKKKTSNTIAPSYNGTAHATGTALFDSPAHAKGTNWAIEDDETALVNELGTEGLVRDGRFYQIPGGAQFINLKRGDIIFNHKQVEELNKHGHVISGGGHGKAYANGTLSSIPAHWDSTASGNVNSNGWKGSGGGDSGGGTSGLKTSIDNAAKAVEQGTTATNQGTQSTNQSTAKVETALDKFKKWADSLFDWVEVRMERLQHSIDMNTAQSELNNTYQKKNSEINKAMKTTRQMIGDQEIGADKYKKQAAKVASKAVSMGALSQGKVNELVKRIQKGELDIMEYKARKKPQQSSSSKSSSSSSSNSQSEEETPELTFIEEYKEWWDKSEQMRLSILENKQALKDLAQTKLDNIIEQYDTIVGLSEQIQSKADAQKENYLTYGKDMRSKSVEKTVDTRVDQQKRITKARQEEEKAYQKELKSAKKDFGENSNQYREALVRLEEISTSRIESQTAERQIKVDYQEERLQSIQDKWEQLAGYAAAVQSSSESMANLLETQGTDVRKSSYENEIKAQRKQQNEQTKAYKNEMKYYEDEMKRAKKLYGESSKMYIDAKTNFEEMKKNHRDSMQQYIEIEKNYQQKRLDYLKEKWDSFINLAEARQATAKSKEGLYNAQGRPLNGTQIKDAYLDQRYQQDQVTKYYQKLQKDLQAEESRMRKVYGTNSNEYRAWQAELEAATKGLNDSKTASIDLRNSFMELDAQVMNFDITRLKQTVESMANSVALREKRGTRVGETGNGINDSDYTGQISANQKQIALYRQLAEYYRLQQTGLDKSSKQYMEYEQKIYGAKNAIDSLNMSNEELKESARNNRWKSFYKLSDQLDLMVSDYTHLIGLMNEESFFDDNGNGYQLTMNGLSAIALYGDQMEANRQKVALYQEGLKALNEELKNNMISEEKYIEEQKKLLGGVQEATTAIHSEKEAIIALTKTQLTNEANMLKKIIQNRKDALSAKKA